MCTVPPPPPLPDYNEELKPVETPPKITYPKDNDLCKWALDIPELHEACTRVKICTNKPPYKYKYTSFDSISQEGPTCGIVALSMVVRGAISPTNILKMAKEKNYTNNGEMFSCKNMLKLASEVLQLNNNHNTHLTLEKGEIFTQKTVNRLLNGSVLLVPYDADVNHTPCLKNGHKSHWSLVCGIIVENGPVDLLDPNDVYCLCRHGKSKYLSAWKLQDLTLSNGNLNEFPARKGEQLSMYMMPDGGVGGEDGLKSQYIVIDRVSLSDPVNE